MEVEVRNGESVAGQRGIDAKRSEAKIQPCLAVSERQIQH
jgi:hypothetical protein